MSFRGFFNGLTRIAVWFTLGAVFVLVVKKSGQTITTVRVPKERPGAWTGSVE